MLILLVLYDLLCDAYSYDERNKNNWEKNWKGTDDFFYDNPEIADKYGFVTCIDGKCLYGGFSVL